MKTISRKNWVIIGIGLLIFIFSDKNTLFTLLTAVTFFLFLFTFHRPSREKFAFVQKVSTLKGRLLLFFLFIVFTIGAGLSASFERDAELAKQTKEAEALTIQNETKAQEILGRINPLIDEGKITDVQSILSQEQGVVASSTQLSGIQEDITKITTEKVVKGTLVELSEEEYSLLQSSSLTKKFLSNEKLNILFVQKLAEIADQRPGLIAERKEAERIQKEEAERVKKEAEAVERKKLVEKQFSAWDGSHRNLARVIKESMNDPDSYEHVETSYTDNGDYLIVLTKFRGKNGFGGTVLNAVKAKVSVEGDVLDILEQYP